MHQSKDGDMRTVSYLSNDPNHEYHNELSLESKKPIPAVKIWVHTTHQDTEQTILPSVFPLTFSTSSFTAPRTSVPPPLLLLFPMFTRTLPFARGATPVSIAMVR